MENGRGHGYSGSKSAHVSNNYTCGPVIAKLDCITASLAEPSFVFHLLVGSFSASKLE